MQIQSFIRDLTGDGRVVSRWTVNSEVGFSNPRCGRNLWRVSAPSALSSKLSCDEYTDHTQCQWEDEIARERTDQLLSFGRANEVANTSYPWVPGTALLLTD